MKEFQRAMEDCQMAIRLNPEFARTYKRLFKSHLALGNIIEANEALQIALQKDPSDKSNKADLELMETVSYQNKMIEKFRESGDPSEKNPEKCAFYCNQILENSTHSVKHICLRVESLLRSLQLPQAKEFMNT